MDCHIFLLLMTNSFFTVSCPYLPHAEEIQPATVILPANHRGRYLATIARRQAVDGTFIKFHKRADRIIAQAKKKVNVLSDEILSFVIQEQNRRIVLYKRIMAAVQSGERGITIAEIRNKPAVLIKRGILYRCPSNRALLEPNGNGTLLCEENIEPTPILYDSCLSAEDKPVFVANNKYFLCNRHRLEGPDPPRNGTHWFACAHSERTSLNYTYAKCALDNTNDVVVQYRYYPDKAVIKLMSKLDPDSEMCDHWNPCQIGYVFGLPEYEDALTAIELWKGAEKGEDKWDAFERDEIVPPIPEDSIEEFVYNSLKDEEYETSERRIPVPKGYTFLKLWAKKLSDGVGWDPTKNALGVRVWLDVTADGEVQVVITYPKQWSEQFFSDIYAIFRKIDKPTSIKPVKILSLQPSKVELTPVRMTVVPGQVLEPIRIPYKCSGCHALNVILRTPEGNVVNIDPSKYTIKEDSYGGKNHFSLDLGTVKVHEYGDYYAIIQNEDGVVERVKLLTLLRPGEEDTGGLVDMGPPIRVSAEIGEHVHEDATYNCVDECTLLNVFVNGEDAIASGKVVHDKQAQTLFIESTSYTDDMAGVYTAVFKVGDKIVSKVFAIVETKSPLLDVINYETITAPLNGSPLKRITNYKCSEDCTVAMVTVNGDPIDSNKNLRSGRHGLDSTGYYTSVPNSIIADVPEYSDTWKGLYQGVFVVGDEKITKNLFEIEPNPDDAGQNFLPEMANPVLVLTSEVNVGKPVSMNCTGVNGSEFTFEYRKIGKAISTPIDTNNNEKYVIKGNQLTINNINYDDFGKWYCIVDGKKSKSTELRDEVKIKITTPEIKIGKPAEMECSGTGKQVSFMVKKPGETLEEATKIVENNKFKIKGNKLIINNVQKSDFGSYYCSIDGKESPEEDASGDLSQIHLVAPDEVTLGSPATFKCEGDGKATYLFQEPGKNISKPINMNDKKRYTVQGNDLIINKVTTADFGTYFCEMEGALSNGEELRESVKIELMTDINDIVIDGPASFTCVGKGDEISFEFQMKGLTTRKPVLPDKNRYEIKGRTLTIHKLQKFDIGTYFCEVDGESSNGKVLRDPVKLKLTTPKVILGDPAMLESSGTGDEIKFYFQRPNEDAIVEITSGDKYTISGNELKINSVSEDDFGYYYSSVDGVQSPPVWLSNVKLSQSNTDIKIGGSAKFHCDGEGYQYFFYQQSGSNKTTEIIPKDNPEKYTVTGNHLTINYIDEDDFGTYFCSSNDVQSNPVDLKDNVEVILTTDEVLHDKPVTLQCEGIGENVTFEYTRKGYKEITKIEEWDTERYKIKGRELTINKMQNRDLGSYYCKVDGKRSKGILLKYTIKLTLKTNPVKIGQSSKFECNTQGPWTFQFRKTSKDLDTDINVDANHDIISRELIVKKTQESDFGYYYCTVNGDQSNGEWLSDVNLHMTSSEDAKLGTPSTMKCDGHGSLFTFAYKKTGSTKYVDIDVSNTQKYKIKGNELTINEVDEDDLGTYTCKADGRQSNRMDFRDEVRLKLTTDEIVENKPARLQCVGSGKKVEFEYVWKGYTGHYKIPVQDKSRYTTKTSRELIINRMQDIDLGTYFCCIDGKHSNGVELRYDVVAKLKTMDVELGSPAKFECTGGADPKWAFQKAGETSKKNINSGSDYQIKNSQLNVKAVQKSDYGNYFCTVDGIQSKGEPLSAVSLKLDDPEIIVGRPVVLKCESNTLSNTFYFQKPGESSPTQINEKDTSKFTIKGNELRINSVAASDFGQYFCKDDNQWSNGVKLGDPVTIELLTKQIVKLKPVTFRCIGTGQQYVYQYIWKNHEGQWTVEHEDKLRYMYTGKELKINKMYDRDLGTYTCKIDGEQSINSVKLKYDVMILLETKTIETGKPVKFKCIGDGPWKFQYQRKGADSPFEIKPSQKYNIDDEYLTIQDIQSSDYGKYFCTAGGVQAHPVAISDVKVDILTNDIKIGNPIEMQCKNASGKVSFQFQKSGTNSPTAVTEDNRIKIDGNKLKIDKLEEADIGTYFCKSAGVTSPGELLRDAVELKQITSNIKLKKPATFECKFTGHGATFKFLSEGSSKPVAVNIHDKNRYEYTGKQLTIKNLSEKDIGTYFCEVDSVLSNGVAISVDSIGLVLLTKQEDIDSEKDARFECNATGDIVFMFQRTGSSIRLNITANAKYSIENKKYLVVRKIAEDDIGLYYCTSKYMLSNSAKLYFLYVHIEIPPQTTNPDIINIKCHTNGQNISFYNYFKSVHQEYPNNYKCSLNDSDYTNMHLEFKTCIRQTGNYTECMIKQYGCCRADDNILQCLLKKQIAWRFSYYCKASNKTSNLEWMEIITTENPKCAFDFMIREVTCFHVLINDFQGVQFYYMTYFGIPYTIRTLPHKNDLIGKDPVTNNITWHLNIADLPDNDIYIYNCKHSGKFSNNRHLDFNYKVRVEYKSNVLWTISDNNEDGSPAGNLWNTNVDKVFFYARNQSEEYTKEYWIELIGSYHKEENTLYLECVTNKYIEIWFYMDEVIPSIMSKKLETFEFDDSIKTRKMKIKNVGVDNVGKYLCRDTVTEFDEDHPLEKQTHQSQVFEFILPSTITFERIKPKREIEIKTGSTVEFLCSGNGKKTEFEYRWRDDGIPRKFNSLYNERWKADGRKLTVIRVTDSEYGRFYCIVDGILSHPAVLREITLTSVIDDQNFVRARRRVLLTCFVSGVLVDETNYVTWWFKKQGASTFTKVEEGEYLTIENYGMGVIIYRLIPELYGWYKCRGGETGVESDELRVIP